MYDLRWPKILAVRDDISVKIPDFSDPLILTRA